jgi:hypothetical protein
MTYATEPAVVLPEDPAAPRVTRRRAAATVVLGLALAGVAVGALWAVLAPPVAGVVGLTRAGDRVRGFVGDAADQLFLGAFLIPGMVSVVAIVTAAAVWRWRAHRGPVLAGALVVGSMIAAAAAAGVGAALAHWRYGAVDVAGAPVSPEHRVHYVTEAPAVFFGHTPLQIALTIVFPAGLAALAYALCVLSTPRDDLGAWPPVEPRAFVPTGTPVGPVGVDQAPITDPTVTDPARTAADVPPVDPGSPSR